MSHNLPVSLFFIGTILGSLIAGVIYARLGSKWTARIVAPIVLANWIVTAFSKDITVLLLTRFIAGVTYGTFVNLGERKIEPWSIESYDEIAELFFLFQSRASRLRWRIPNIVAHWRHSTQAFCPLAFVLDS